MIPTQAEFELMVARLIAAYQAIALGDWRADGFAHAEKMLAQVLDAYRMARAKSCN